MTQHHVTVEELGEGPWWLGHDHPERPPDEFTAWSWACDPCMIHLVAAAAMEPASVAHDVVHDVLTVSTLSHTLELAREWRAEQGLRPL